MKNFENIVAVNLIADEIKRDNKTTEIVAVTQISQFPLTEDEVKEKMAKLSDWKEVYSEHFVNFRFQFIRVTTDEIAA